MMTIDFNPTERINELEQTFGPGPIISVVLLPETTNGNWCGAINTISGSVLTTPKSSPDGKTAHP